MNTIVFGSAFFMGIFGSVHCVAMCGGIVGVLCGSAKSQTSVQQIAYQIGRVCSYSLLGMFAGLFGNAISSYSPVFVAQVLLRGIAALMMLGAGLYLAGVFHEMRFIEKLGQPLWRRVEPLAKRILPARTIKHAWLLGLLWGMLPCGLVYAAIALSVTAESALNGATTMLFFGLGTLPSMLTVGQLTKKGVTWFQQRYVKLASGVLLAIFGIVNGAIFLKQASSVFKVKETVEESCCHKAK